MFIHHEEVPSELLYRFAHLALLLRRLYTHEVHRTAINCHALVTVLAPLLKLRAVHGYIAGYDRSTKKLEFCEHSWMQEGDFVIDPKPDACVAFSPLLIRVSGYSPFIAVYHEGSEKETKAWLRTRKTRAGIKGLKEGLRRIQKKDPITKDQVVNLIAYGAPA